MLIWFVLMWFWIVFSRLMWVVFDVDSDLVCFWYGLSLFGLILMLMLTLVLTLVLSWLVLVWFGVVDDWVSVWSDFIWFLMFYYWWLIWFELNRFWYELNWLDFFDLVLIWVDLFDCIELDFLWICFDLILIPIMIIAMGRFEFDDGLMLMLTLFD